MTAMRLPLECSDRLPRMSPRHLPRTRLSARLLASPERVKLFCAPAGSGKTALLSECARQAPVGCRVHWLSLSDTAGTPEAFCVLLATVLGLASSTEADVLERLARMQTPTWLFLDDYSRCANADLDGLLDALLLHSSAHLNWWVCGRRRPSCNWPRLLLEGDLLECDGRALAFTATEIDQLLARQPCDWPQQTAGRILQLTDGWAAGVRIAMIDAVDGSGPEPGSGTLSAYLDHELFAGLPSDLAEIWRVLAALPRFDASLCEHLFGAGEGAAGLRQLQALGCFIEPWEHSPRWLQVFPPLARHQRASSSAPGRSWHRRACQWFALQGDWQTAFEQACQACEYEAAVSLLQHLQLEHLYERQNVLLLVNLYLQHGESLMFGDPQWVCLIAGALLITGRFEQAQGCIEQLSRFLPPPSAPAQHELIARWQALHGCLLHLQGRAAPACEHLQAALAHLPDTAWQMRLLCFSGLIQQALLRGELNLAQAYIRDALCLARAKGSLLLEAVLELDHAQLLEQRGALHRAQELLLSTWELLQIRHCRSGPLAGRIALRLGRLAARLGQDEQAVIHYEQGLQACLHSQDKRAFYGFLGLATLEAGQGRYSQAFVRLREAERLMQLHHVPDLVYRGVLLLVSSYFWLQQGRPALVRETLTRVLRHYRGPHAIQAPPATLELIPRIEALLVLAEVQLQQASAPLERLQSLLDQARHCGMQALEAELYLVMAEVAFVHNDQGVARDCLDKGLTLSDRLGLVQPVNELRLRQPGLLLAMGMETEPLEPGDNPLSFRELEVLKLIAQGNSNQQIAEQLFISLHTVKTHARRIHSKLGVERRTQAVAMAKKIGLMN
ncbi:LuxR C-terminal-related transcriptional regulator [Pseudomonas akapageensis]|uniref:LuxR C-terminal-related transcriptional regulator n=1 Tax=Pseudomonas akapageensis TaxID=2609961 RepID=UPI00140C9A18|nr:LuxR C-terminal-related transcriptional regulator [Pseudomonas akapageensis]